jgi:transcriptional regulator with XRE-family HTH domain
VSASVAANFANSIQSVLPEVAVPESELQKLRNKVSTLTYSEIAKQVGVDVSYVSLVLRGLRNPSTSILLKMAETLECNIVDLLDYVEEVRRGRDKTKNRKFANRRPGPRKGLEKEAAA